MNTSTKCYLWTNRKHSRYFLIPDDQEFPDGDFLILNNNGTEISVDLSSINSFEISEEEARLFWQQEMEKILKQTKFTLSNLIKIAAKEISKTSPKVEQQNYPSGAKFVADLLGVTPQEVLNDPETAKMQFRKVILEGITDVIEGVTSEDSQQQDIARDQMRQWEIILQSQGFEIGEVTEKLMAQLREKLLKSDVDTLLQ